MPSEPLFQLQSTKSALKEKQETKHWSKKRRPKKGYFFLTFKLASKEITLSIKNYCIIHLFLICWVYKSSNLITIRNLIVKKIE